MGVPPVVDWLPPAEGAPPVPLIAPRRRAALLPDEVPGMLIERLELPQESRLIGVPHTPGTREYLTCERGEIELVASGSSFHLVPGDVAVFRGDQRHSYANVGRGSAVGFSVVMLIR